MKDIEEERIDLNFKLSQLAVHNKEIAESASNAIAIINELVDKLFIANKELLYQTGERRKRSAELVVADAEKAKNAAELLIANADKAMRASELVMADAEKAKRAAELVIANKELLFQAEEKAKRAAELVTANTEALYDQLTNLPNRRLFIDRFNQIFLSSKRNKSYTAILFLDLDKFKAVNDCYGHAVGDQLLIEVSERMKKSIRETDTVARLGGDEFAVVLGSLNTDLKVATIEVEGIAEKIRSSIAMPVSCEQDGKAVLITPQCTVSIGVNLFLYAPDEPSAILEGMLASSDKSMYQVKKAGGNQIRFDSLK